MSASRYFKNYASYAETLALKELQGIKRNTDRDKYPERYRVLVELIKKKDKKKDRTQKKSQPTVFPNIPTSPWPYPDLIAGALVLLIPWVFDYAIKRFSLISYRPWMAKPVCLFVWVAWEIVVFWYAIFVCKKRGFWPLLPRIPFSGLLKEFLKSFLLVILINILVGLSITLLSLALKIQPHIAKQWEFATYAPNSVILLFILVFAFTLAPVIEEIFYRGFLYGALKTRFSVPVAMTIQALVFALWHRYDFLNTFCVFLIGIALAIVYEKRKSLYSPIFVHAIKNAMFAVFLIILILGNLHKPAENWNEAVKEPEWLNSSLSHDIDRQQNGIQQWQYAIDTWGSKGSKQWKKEIKAFNAVCTWFPEDRKACAKARLGIVEVYHYFLNDHRRAIIEADRLQAKYPDQTEQCANALSIQGWSYYVVRDFENSRKTFDRLISEFRQYENIFKSAQEGIRRLNDLEK
jgi:membrane protease YdiL (CAAX protease family)